MIISEMGWNVFPYVCCQCNKNSYAMFENPKNICDDCAMKNYKAEKKQQRKLAKKKAIKKRLKK